ncbi:S-adenosyl-L-methionine-dependent methyltransferases superfamily protein [Rhynchospora pubera]|uniref:S-adenosyl-L-methionine-dependent methyltransferases superfamily protein n=1 Tax=Rhynchospora pubera TaxID=906938 RepID=A0AAV8EBJ0_9POAL|nr:S-adenosyl-L-methionine-dependent methyltransferases superfamily protein [Rhynchospora pubera]
MRKDKMAAGGVGAGTTYSMGLNLLLLVAMVATNILSLYHLSSSHRLFSSPTSPPLPLSSSDQAPEHLLRQLHTIRATISHLSHLHTHPSDTSSSSPPPPPELLLLSRLSAISSACASHPTLLRQYMNYTPFSPCPSSSSSLAESLLLRGCHPLPRRRCFSLIPTSNPSSLSNTQDPNFLSVRSTLDLSVPQLLRLARISGAAPINLALDVAGGSGSLADALRRASNTTVLTTTLNLGHPFSQTAASRGFVPLHSPLQSRFPVQDGVLDLVRTGHAVNRWIPIPVLEFLVYDVDRVLRPGGLLWIDHFFCKGVDLDPVYRPLVSRLGYRTIKWAVGDKTDAGGVKNREVYLTALLQKPFAA